MDRSWKWEDNGTTIVRSIARTAPGCHQGCGVLLHVKDGKLIKVEGDPDFPLNRGRLCPRCLAATQVVYHPDRLKYPLKRAGERGAGEWERISWDEVLDTVADKLSEIRKEYGPESVVFCSGTGRNASPYVNMLGATFGSPNFVGFGPLNGNACYAPKIATMAALFGSFAVADCAQSYPERFNNPEWKVPECIVIWGTDPLVCSADGFLGHWIIDCLKRGSELIVIDPRKTWLASRARVWLQIRPGTDAALALAMLNVIINERLYDEDYVREWTYGFDELKERVQEYPPDKVADITWIPEKLIIEAARLYAASKPATVQWGVAVDQSKECIPTLHAITALWSITGNMDVPGGNIIRGQLQRAGMPKIHQQLELDKSKRIGIGKYPFMDWANMLPGEAFIDQILSDSPYPLRASWIQGTNTFTCGAADARRTYDAFKKLDFNVVVDLFMTPTAMAFADIVMPVSTYPERDGIYSPIGGATCLSVINKAIEPIGECRSDMEIDLEMGKRLNPELWPWDNVRDMFDEMLKVAGVTFEELRDMGYLFGAFEYRKQEKGLLRPDGKPGFNTPTGKLELYSTIFDKCGLDPLPYFEEPPESPVSTPQVASEYPLVLTTGARTWAFFHSEHRQIPRLRSMNPDPIVEIHPDTAGKFGIQDGDWVYIENKYGRCRQKARLAEGILPGVVSAQHAWWFPEKPGPEPSLFGVWESNINLLLPSGWVGKSGLGFPFKSQMCRVYKMEEPPNA